MTVKMNRYNCNRTQTGNFNENRTSTNGRLIPEKMLDFIKRFMLIFSVGCLILPMLWAFVPIQGEAEIYSETLRLHVLANSDTPEDQALKLKVRDAVLNEMQRIAENEDCYGFSDAKKLAEDNIDVFRKCSLKVIEESGYDYPVSVTLGQEHFPTREYEGVRLPAGEYTALRICIGNAEGRNWWCVLYPTLCLDAAEPKKELAEAGFTQTQIRLLTDNESPRYVLRFKLLEWLGELFG